ncbi:hypothetical protein CLV56_2954 [Mumia flava]|uniref:Uncharacterized protein n=1 Tax=Mumia flava TaxID=1348852 RepID=A0A0B2B8A9_9ACTN|nr:hypothetical protein [Mumia flava]PJJ53465.1 hypothetical protein CLV56_2954 [Mumia flava]
MGERTGEHPFWRFWEASSTGQLITLATAVVGLVGVLVTVWTTGGGDRPDPTPATTIASAPPSTAPVTAAASATAWSAEDDVLSVSVTQSFGGFPGAGATFLMPPGAIVPEEWPRRLEDPEDFARQHGGVAAGAEAATLVVRTDLADPVVVTSITPRVVERRLVEPGSYAVKVPYGCGVMPVRTALADFETDPVSISYETGEGDPPGDALVLRVSRDEPEAVTVQGSSRSEAVQWEVVLAYETTEGTGTLPVQGPGGPFVVTAVPEDTPVYWFTDGQGLEPDTTGVGDPYGYC